MHESNSFNPVPTVLEDFTWIEPSLDRWAAGSTEVAGFVEAGRAEGWELLPTIYGHAMPRGPVTAAAFETICERLIAGLRAAAPFDGILLGLHGAMYAESYPHADEEITRRVRAAFPRPMPLVMTHDFHGNVSPETVALTDALIGYKQNPHLDTKDRGRQAVAILRGMLDGSLRPVQAIAKPPMIWNIVHQNTSVEPLRSITEETVRLEAENPRILAASVLGGYQYNDVPYLGPSAVVVTDGDEELATREAERLSGLLWERHVEANTLGLPDAAAAVAAAMTAEKYPVALFDIGDNIGGGSAGDATTLLAELLRQGAAGWVVVVYDPEAVEAAKRAGIDGEFAMEVGGKSDDRHGAPVHVRGRVRSLHAGRYIETAVRHGGGRYWSLGHTAVLEAEGSTPDLANYVVVTSERSSPNSIHQIVHLGIYPERQRILVAKGTIAPRAAYLPVAAEIVMVDTPGATSVNPARFRFAHVRPGVEGIG